MPDLFLDVLQEGGSTKLSIDRLSDAEAIAMLQSAEITAASLIPWGSNYSFAVALDSPDGATHLGIYKPRAGEAPLHDFRSGTLYKREIAAYRLSQWLDWQLVPPTIEREGPHGIGSLQLYIQPAKETGDPESLWGTSTIDNERMVLFDHIANNADRKLSHCLLDVHGVVWGIDHGLTFNEHPKIRTIMWQFSGEPISAEFAADLQRIEREYSSLKTTLAGLLHPRELEALRNRVRFLAATGYYPELDPYRNIPYGWW